MCVSLVADAVGGLNRMTHQSATGGIHERTNPNSHKRRKSCTEEPGDGLLELEVGEALEADQGFA